MLNTYYLLFLFSCLLFIMVVFIEASIMRKWFKTETFGELVKINLVSNGLSKLVVLPIVSFSFIILLLFAVEKFLGNLIFVLSLPFAILLFFIAYHISVWIEQWVVTKFLGTKYNQETISQAVRSANKASYMLIFIACILGFAAAIGTKN